MKVTSLDVRGNTYDVDTSQLTWRPSAYALIIQDDKILLSKQQNKYHLVGGGLYLGESPEQAVIREVKEESGLEVDRPHLLACKSSFFTYRSDDNEPVHVQSLLFYFTVRLLGGELSTAGLMPDEVANGNEAVWVDLSELNHLPVGSTVDWRPVAKNLL